MVRSGSNQGWEKSDQEIASIMVMGLNPISSYLKKNVNNVMMTLKDALVHALNSRCVGRTLVPSLSTKLQFLLWNVTGACVKHPVLGGLSSLDALFLPLDTKPF